MVLCQTNVWHHLGRYLVASWMIIQEMTYVEPAEKTAIGTMGNSPLTSAWKFTSVTAFLVKLNQVCKTMKMTRNADSLACTCLRSPGNYALLKISKPSTKETREVRAVFSVVSVICDPCTCRPRRHPRITSRCLNCDDVEGHRPS